MGVLSLSVGAIWPRAAVWGLKLCRQAPRAPRDPGLLTPALEPENLKTGTGSV